MPVRRPRIKDVAERAGVSPTTVSLVLNSRPGARIPDDTRDRVHRAAAEIGYTPNTLARNLRTRGSQTIGFVSDEITTTPFAVRMVEAAQEAAWARGYLLFLVNTGGSAETERATVEALLQQQVDRFVYACMWHRVVPLPVGLPTDTVFLNARPVGGGHRAVVPDDRAGARAAIRELLAHGHRRIAFIDDELAPEASGLRLLGYHDALAEHGVAPDPALHVRTSASTRGGAAAGGALFDRPAAERPTGFFCFNDRVAMGAYRAARHRGLRVPEDVSIVGYDDQEFIAAELDPPLTTVALPHREMGRWAIEALLGPEGSHDGRTDEPVLMPCPLIRRESVGPPPG
jgi:LacI family transcriptional regulator